MNSVGADVFWRTGCGILDAQPFSRKDCVNHHSCAIGRVYMANNTTKRRLAAAAVLKEGDGGGTFDAMEQRVKALEDDMKRVLQDTAEIKGMLRAAPSAIEFGELKGRVNSLPTMGKAAAMLSIATAVIVILNNWTAIRSWLVG
jgi:hypothetical protein